MIRVHHSLFSYDAKTRTLSAEISQLPFEQMPNTFEVEGKKGIAVFKWFKTDTDGSGEDTYGWHYQNLTHKLKLLIIND
jgi:hypothetical protein